LRCAWAPQIARFESLWQYLQAVLAYAVPPVVALFLVGMFSARANARGAFATIVVGLLGGAGLFYANVLSSTPMGLHFLLVAPDPDGRLHTDALGRQSAGDCASDRTSDRPAVVTTNLPR
jgi:hypothetical protein